MLRVGSNSMRCAGYSACQTYLKNKALPAHTLPAAAYQVRHSWIGKSWRRFWNGKSEEPRENEDVAMTGNLHTPRGTFPFSQSLSCFYLLDPDTASTSNGQTSNQLVSSYGDDAPRLSPIVILPVMRHPIFPGFMVTLLISFVVSFCLTSHDNSYILCFLFLI